MKNVGHICDKYMYIDKIYNQMHLLGIVIHFEYNNSESANVLEMLFNQVYEKTEPF